MTTTLIGAPATSPDLHTYGEFDDRMLKSDLRWNRKTAAGTELDAQFGLEWSARRMYVGRLGFDGAGQPSYSDPVRGVETRSWLYPGGVKLRTTLEMKF